MGVKAIDIKDIAESLAAVAEDICPSAEVNTLVRPPVQGDALSRLVARVPEGAGVLDAVRAGLTDEGAVLLRNVPVASDTLLVLLGAAAAPAVTSGVYGDNLVDHLTPVAADEEKLRAQNQRSEMLLHTDASAQQCPPDFVGLACVANEGQGGRSVLLHVDDAVAALSGAGDEDSLKNLQERYPFVHPQHQDKAPVLAPVLSRADDGFRVRYRKQNLEAGVLLAGQSVTSAQRAGLATLTKYFESGVATVELRLDAGDYLLFDNTLYLHGRTEIEPGAHRLLKRTYFHKGEAAC
ncbi:TauD/TfdA family dioxygenase [Streptomyces sp. NPDC004752]